jgi:hypothetical protein
MINFLRHCGYGRYQVMIRYGTDMYMYIASTKSPKVQKAVLKKSKPGRAGVTEDKAL